MTDTRTTGPIPRAIWVGFVAAAFYIVLAAVGGNLFGAFAGDDETLEFVLSHYVPVPVLIAVGLVLLWRAGWTQEAFTSPSPFTERGRWWMLAIPVVLAAQTISLLVGVPWSQTTVAVVVSFLIGTLLIGFGEELYFRGIFRVTVLGHHRELAALLITSFAFGFAHSVGYLFDGLGIVTILSQTLFLSVDGALFYGALRATGTLWVPILLHGVGDFARYLQAGGDDGTRSAMSGNDMFAAVTIWITFILAIALVVSVARQDHRARRAAAAADSADVS